MPAKVLAIAPYEGLKEQLLLAQSQRDDVELTVYVGDLSYGADIVKSLEDTNYDVILSRGGTAQEIEKIARLPVIDIVPSVFDTLRSIRLAQGAGVRFAVVAFANITSGIDRVFELLGLHGDFFTITTSQDAQRIITQLRSGGYQLIVGDAIAVATAESLQMTGMMIPSGLESVHSALDQTMNIHKSISAIGDQNRLYRHALKQKNLFLFAYAQDGTPQFSSAYEDQIEIARIARRLPSYIAPTLGRGALHIIRRAKGNLFHIDGTPILEGGDTRVLFSVRYAPETFLADKDAVLYDHMLDENVRQVVPPLDSIGAMNDIHKQLLTFSRTLSPLVIKGEEGVPAMAAVCAIHQQSPLAMHTLLTLKCPQLSKKAFMHILESENSPLGEINTSICIYRPDALSEELQEAFVRYATLTLLEKRNRIIYVVFPQSDVTSPILRHIANIGSLKTLLPPLRTRIEDLPGLCNLYLSHLSLEVGHQVIGLSSEAQTLLDAYDFPGNHAQLYNILRQGMLVADGNRLEVSAIKTALDAEASSATITDPVANSVIHGTLEEIEERIVRQVLQEEGGSRVRVVERLGISRTTLWRILRKGEDEAEE